MSPNGMRIVALNGLLLMIAGMALGGFPLVGVVVHDAYHGPAGPPGDYRAWMMAHLEGLLNGMMIILLALVSRLRPLSAAGERRMIAALLISGWGNSAASIAAPILRVRGMTFDADPANNLVAGVFTLALVGSVYALAALILHLARPIADS
jgi:hypothetical protein